MRYLPGKSKDYLNDIILRTNGKEFMSLNGKEYIGYYHIFSSNPYTGIEHDQNSRKLIKYNPDKNFVEYINLHNFYLLNKYKDPINYYPILSENDYDKSVFTRYFIKKRNDNNFRIIEIDENQYDSLSQEGSGINEKYYFGISLEWKLTGPKNDIKDNNRIIVYGIEDTNKRTVNLKEKEMNGIESTLKNYLQFSTITQ